MPLSDVSISIKTFLRDPYLFNTIAAIQKNLPECKMIITDDGEMTEEKDGIYADVARAGNVVITLPFDSGFGKKSNLTAAALDTKYLLTGSDDFDFSTAEARLGVVNLVGALDRHREYDIASGRVNGNPYEFLLIESGDTITEKPLNIDTYFQETGLQWYTRCDLTVNYSLIRRKVFRQVHWDNDVKIGGGEHGAFFVDCMRAGFRTVLVPNVNINEQKGFRSPAYWQYRKRGFDPARPCFDRRGIKKYVCGDGTVDYDATLNSGQVL